MKSRQVIWLLLIYCIVNLPSLASANSNPTSVSKKVYILLRTEQNSENLQKFKSLVETNLHYNNVNAQINTFKVTEPLPQMKIFKAAYQENFDFILLIDQVANFNVAIANKKVHVGGKFKLQSYDLKSSNPSWTNHGDANCNITIKESVQRFSEQIVNYISSNKTFHIMDASVTTPINSKNNVEEIFLSETNYLKEIKLLKAQIELQKAKTERTLNEIKLLILKTEKELELELEKYKNLTLQMQKYR